MLCLVSSEQCVNSMDRFQLCNVRLCMGCGGACGRTTDVPLSPQVGNVGAVYLAMGDFASAVECHTEHLRLAKQLGNRVEEARAYSNLGSSHHYRRCFDQARSYHEQVLRIARELGDRVIEARAYAGLGHAARCMGDGQQARRWHEKQLDMALTARDKVTTELPTQSRTSARRFKAEWLNLVVTSESKDYAACRAS